MILQDGAAQKATARNTDSLTIRNINVTESNSDRLLVLSFAAKGDRMNDPRSALITCGGIELNLSDRGTGFFGSQFGGVWIYTLAAPENGQDVKIDFQGMVADDIAAVVTVFHGVDQSNPIGTTDGVFGNSPDSIFIAPASSESRLISALVCGNGEENRFAEAELLSTLDTGDMALTVSITDSRGQEQEIEFNFSGPQNAIALVELCPAAALTGEGPRVTEIHFRDSILAIDAGTTSEDGTTISGQYGTLTMGADGSYDYIVDPDIAASLEGQEIIEEEFEYLLTNGNESAIYPLRVAVNAPDEESTEEVYEAVEPEEIPPDEEHGVLAVTEIRFSGGSQLPVEIGTTSANGTSIEGNFGTLTIGADGSYSYLVDKDDAHRISPSDTVNEVFSYVLSNGTESRVATLSVEVEGVITEDTEDTPPGSQEGVNPGVFAITEISAGKGELVAVASGSTATSGGTNVSGAYGMLTIGSDGSYEYVVDHSRAGSYLDSPVEIFTYTISDGVTKGTSQQLKITATVPEREIPEIPEAQDFLEEPEMVLEDQVPEDQVPEDQVPEDQVPEDQAPEDQAPEDQAPEDQAPEDQAPEDQAPEDQAPEDLPSEVETIVYQVSFDNDMEGLRKEDFEVTGADGAVITELTPVSSTVFDLTIEGVNLSTYQETIDVTYLGDSDESPEIEGNVPEPVKVEPEVEVPEMVDTPPPTPLPDEPLRSEETEKPPVVGDSLPGYSSSITMMSSGATTSYSDFSSARFTSEIDLTGYDAPVVDIVTPAPRLITLSNVDVPGAIIINTDLGPGKIGKSAATALPLEGLTKLFRKPEDKRFFCGVRIEEGNPGDSHISYIPYFAGAASPGATIKISIKNSFGIEIIAISEVADLSGYWTAAPEVDLEEAKYTITIEETPATWDGTTLPTRTTAAQFFGGIPAKQKAVSSMLPGQIVGGIVVGSSIEEMVNDMMEEPFSV